MKFCCRCLLFHVLRTSTPHYSRLWLRSGNIPSSGGPRGNCFLKCPLFFSHLACRFQTTEHVAQLKEAPFRHELSAAVPQDTRGWTCCKRMQSMAWQGKIFCHKLKSMSQRSSVKDWRARRDGSPFSAPTGNAVYMELGQPPEIKLTSPAVAGSMESNIHKALGRNHGPEAERNSGMPPCKTSGCGVAPEQQL